MKYVFCLLLVFLFKVPQISQCQAHPFFLSVSTHELTIVVNEIESFKLLSRGNLTENVHVTFVESSKLVDISPPWVYLNSSETDNSRYIFLTGIHPGLSVITAITAPNETWIAKDVLVRITVCNSEITHYVSILFGWIYFVAWSISFYPQILINFRRESVVGLNFDFVSLNIFGFTLYSIFNIGLFWVPAIQEEYFRRHPSGLNPVLENDIFFSLHAVFATSVIVIQCILYDRGNQRVSYTTIGILSIFAITIIVSASLAAAHVIHWLDFLYICSYIKLSITLIKYVPQALMNFRRKSTEGWCIGNVLLDCLGGSLSMLQMILNAYNYDDWTSIFGDPTKFGLGLFSVCFDIFFMLQHYVFYRHNQPYEEITDEEMNRPENELSETH